MFKNLLLLIYFSLSLQRHVNSPDLEKALHNVANYNQILTHFCKKPPHDDWTDEKIGANPKTVYLSECTFGKVYKIDIDGVTKVLKVINMDSEEYFKYLMREVNIGFKALNSKAVDSFPALMALAHIDECYARIVNAYLAQVYIIAPYYEMGDLRRFMQSHLNSGFTNSFDWKLNVLFKIASGLQLLHDHGYIHRDIKPENIFMEDNDNPVIGDFGFVRETQQATTVLGTPLYIAPEIQMEMPYDNKVDVYALGILFFEVINSAGYSLKTSVMADIKDWCFTQEFVKNSFEEYESSVYCKYLEPLVLSMVAKDPKKRYNMKQVIDELTKQRKDIDENEKVFKNNIVQNVKIEDIPNEGFKTRVFNFVKRIARKLWFW